MSTRHRFGPPGNRYFVRGNDVAMSTSVEYDQQFVDAGFLPLRRASVLKALRSADITTYIDALDVPVCRAAFRDRMRRQ
jgi:hypothetical protein